MKRGTVRSLLLAFVPSPLGFLAGLGLALAITIGYILVLSTASGLLLPNLLSGDAELWGSVLVTWIEPIVRTLTENQIVATAVIAAFWAIVGIVLYSTISFTITAAKEARNITDPTMRFYLELFGWHIAVSAIMVGLGFALWPFAQWLTTQTELATQASTLLAFAAYLGAAIAGWFAIFHLYVVLYRLLRRFYIS